MKKYLVFLENCISNTVNVFLVFLNRITEQYELEVTQKNN